MNITKLDLAHELKKNSLAPITIMEYQSIIEAFLFIITSHLKAGDKIELRGFGVFKVKDRKPRPARNPKTGAVVMLPERKVPVLRFSKLPRYAND
jgi:integration host factor subunit beta